LKKKWLWQDLKQYDWDFSLADSDSEVVRCWEWEINRERVLHKVGGEFPKIPWPSPTDEELAIMTPDEFRRYKKDFPFGNSMGEGFPGKPYVEHRRTQGFNALGVILQESIYEDDPMSLPWGAPWERLYHYCGPNWPEQASSDGYIGFADREGRQNSIEVRPVVIDWGKPDSELLKQFAVFLKSNRPTGDDGRPRCDEPQDEPAHVTKGAGAPVRQARANLKALAAYRLCEHYHGSTTRAYLHKEHSASAETTLGPAFNHRGAWSKACGRVKLLLSEMD
jgi:hypothetical protein